MAYNKTVTHKNLIGAATKAKLAAYAPYSKFAVGAAILTKNGRMFTGCNVENVSLGLTICAERSAAAAAIAAGDKEFVMIGVVTDSKKPAVPCGACRQVLAEFNPRMKVIAAATGGEVEEFQLDALLPKPDQGILETDRNV
ncbi:MAG TPA: cytidine deaminase [Chthoniobacterales bacterium]